MIELLQKSNGLTVTFLGRTTHHLAKPSSSAFISLKHKVSYLLGRRIIARDTFWFREHVFFSFVLAYLVKVLNVFVDR